MSWRTGRHEDGRQWRDNDGHRGWRMAGGGAGWDDGRFQGSLLQQERQRTPEAAEAACLSSLQQSIRTVAQTNEIGRATAVRLDAQEGQIRRIEEDTDKISSNLDTSEYLLDGMKSWWGTIKQLVLPPPTANGATSKTSSGDGRGAASAGPSSSSNSGSDGSAETDGSNSGSQWGNGFPFLGFFGGATAAAADPPSQPDAAQQQRQQQVQADQKFKSRERNFDAQLNNNLDELSGMLEEMHSQAVLVGESIERQNHSLVKIHQKVEDNSERVTKQQRDINKLMGR